MNEESKKGRIPVVEIFGPVIQGEGALIGNWTTFVRTGGCDYKCTHCDSFHAVDPKQVAENSTWMSPEEIAQHIINHPELSRPRWVTLSGGNPALWELGEAVHNLQYAGYHVAIETQGSVWKDWINKCDLVTVSPKGAGMVAHTRIDVLRNFLHRLRLGPRVCVKIPVFDEEDVKFASLVAQEQLVLRQEIPLFLSLGNPWPPNLEGCSMYPQPELALRLLDQYRVLSGRILEYPMLRRAIFLPQLHVLLYGNERCK